MKNKHRRKNYLINKKMQFSFLAKFIVLLLIETALIFYLWTLMSADSITTGYSQSILTVQTTNTFYSARFLLILLVVFGAIGITGMFVFILVSHRIAGPIYRFEQVLNQIESGDLTTKVHLRNKDQLIEMQDQLNLLVQSFGAKITNVKVKFKELKEAIEQNKDGQITSEIQTKISQIQKELDYFKVSKE